MLFTRSLLISVSFEFALTHEGRGINVELGASPQTRPSKTQKVRLMNKDIFEGKWTQLKGSAREQWGKLTDNDVEEVKGNYEQFVGKVQERYGVAREEAEKQVDEWTASQEDRRANQQMHDASR